MWGPLSGRFGRRPVLLVGMGGYVLASLACVVAPDMELLELLARIAQGAFMGAAVMSRAPSCAISTSRWKVRA